MTKSTSCRWCERPLPVRQGPGRAREFCSQRCRQWHYVSRRRAGELAVTEGELERSDSELVDARGALDEVNDELFVLACAVDDVTRDLADAGPQPTTRELAQMLDWILDAARPLRERAMGPRVKSS